MTETNNIELRDKDVYPDESVLRTTLDKSYKSYEKLLELFSKNEMSYEWRYYNDGKAWLCKIQKKKRTIIWMSAWNGFIKATIYFPEKHMEKVYNLDIDEKLKQTIKSTKNVGKSKPCTFEIRAETPLNDFEKLMKLKIDCK